VALAIVVAACSDDSVSPVDDATRRSIQDMVSSASVGDTVVLAPGVYTDLHEYTDFLGRTILVACVVKPGVVIRGATGDPADVIIDAQGVGLGFWFHEAGDSTGVSSLTVVNALWGISGYDASPWIDNCILENNGDLENYPASSGTGMYFDRSSSIVTNCVFRFNEAASGGGATFSTSSDCRLENCLFEENYASNSGGGLSLGNASKAVLVNCSFVRNTAGERGGGIFSHGYSIEIVGGEITGNSAGDEGGGCDIMGFVLGASLENVGVSENTAPEGPQGHVWPYTGSVILRCCDTDPEAWAGPVSVEACEADN
jgi:predicted outer membrane repeat protein